MCHAKTDKRRYPHSRDRSCRAVHCIVADVAMFAVDDDALRLVSEGWLSIAHGKNRRRGLFVLPSARRGRMAVPRMS